MVRVLRPGGRHGRHGADCGRAGALLRWLPNGGAHFFAEDELGDTLEDLGLVGVRTKTLGNIQWVRGESRDAADKQAVLAPCPPAGTRLVRTRFDTVGTGGIVLVALAIAVGLVGIVVPLLPGTLLVCGAILVWAVIENNVTGVGDARCGDRADRRHHADQVHCGR